jgi:serine/threonine protein kinase
LEGNRTALPEVSCELKDMMNLIFEHNPKKRINLKNLMTHPFILKYQDSFESVSLSVKEEKPYKSLSLIEFRKKRSETKRHIQKE